MSTEGDQVVVAEGEVTEAAPKAKDNPPSESAAPDCETEQNDSPNAEANDESEKPQMNGIVDSDNAETEAEMSPPAVEEQKSSEDDAKTDVEQAAENEVAASSPPPQIVVDTVPDRDPESPTTPEAPKEIESDAAPVDDKAETKASEPEKPAEPADEPAEAESAKAGEPEAEVKAEASEEKKEDGEAPAVEDGEAPAVAVAAAVANTEDQKPAEDGTTAAEGAAATSGKPDFNGKYRQLESENIEAFLQAVGMPWLMKKMAAKMSPSTEIRQEGDKFHIKLITGFMTKETKFTMGEEFEDGGFGWKKETMKVKADWDGNKIVTVSEPKSEKSKSKPLKITRELDGNRMTMILETGDVVSKRVFEKKK